MSKLSSMSATGRVLKYSSARSRAGVVATETVASAKPQAATGEKRRPKPGKVRPGSATHHTKFVPGSAVSYTKD